MEAQRNSLHDEVPVKGTVHVQGINCVHVRHACGSQDKTIKKKPAGSKWYLNPQQRAEQARIQGELEDEEKEAAEDKEGDDDDRTEASAKEEESLGEKEEEEEEDWEEEKKKKEMNGR